MESCPHHTFQVLTKRAARMRLYLSWRWGEGRIPSRHIWAGVSVEDQARADERVPELLATPAAVRFLSVEPLLGPMDIE
jgi:protein gp37